MLVLAALHNREYISYHIAHFGRVPINLGLNQRIGNIDGGSLVQFHDSSIFLSKVNIGINNTQPIVLDDNFFAHIKLSLWLYRALVEIYCCFEIVLLPWRLDGLFKQVCDVERETLTKCCRVRSFIHRICLARL